MRQDKLRAISSFYVIGALRVKTDYAPFASFLLSARNCFIGTSAAEVELTRRLPYSCFLRVMLHWDPGGRDETYAPSDLIKKLLPLL